MFDRHFILCFGLAAGVRYLDFSTDGKFLLALLEDQENTVCMYSTSTFDVVALMPLNLPTETIQADFEPEKILDIRFAQTGSIFATAGSKGVTFYVEEGPSILGTGGLRVFERRTALYQKIGKEAEGAVFTVLSKFEMPDEMIAGSQVRVHRCLRTYMCLDMVADCVPVGNSLHNFVQFLIHTSSQPFPMQILSF